MQMPRTGDFWNWGQAGKIPFKMLAAIFASGRLLTRLAIPWASFIIQTFPSKKVKLMEIVQISKGGSHEGFVRRGIWADCSRYAIESGILRRGAGNTAGR